MPTTLADPDAALRDWLQAWAKDHPRRGFRNAYRDARDEGWHVNHKKIQRLWREEGLRVPQQRRRKWLGTGTTPNPPKADAPNRVWAVDFQFDATTDRGPVKIVSSVDEHTRECLGGLVERSSTGEDLLDALDRIAAGRRDPAVLAGTMAPSWPARPYLLVTGPGPPREQRREGRRHPPPAAPLAWPASPCRRRSHLRPPVIDAHRRRALFGPTGRRGRESIMA